MKICFKCHEAKDESSFYRHPKMADGLLGKCKECTKRDARNHRSVNAGYYREYDQSRNMLPHRVSARKSYSRTEKGRQAVRGCKERWLDRNPRKRAAQNLFNNRQRYDSNLATQPCEVCKSSELVHAHHENYDEPLKVRWLCPKHHTERHREMRRLDIVP